MTAWTSHCGCASQLGPRSCHGAYYMPVCTLQSPSCSMAEHDVLCAVGTCRCTRQLGYTKRWGQRLPRADRPPLSRPGRPPRPIVQSCLSPRVVPKLPEGISEAAAPPRPHPRCRLTLLVVLGRLSALHHVGKCLKDGQVVLHSTGRPFNTQKRTSFAREPAG